MLYFFGAPTNTDIAGYADENVPYTYSINIDNVPEDLQGALLFYKLFFTLYRNYAIREGIQICKEKETAQCTLEEKAYLLLPLKDGK